MKWDENCHGRISKGFLCGILHCYCNVAIWNSRFFHKRILFTHRIGLLEKDTIKWMNASHIKRYFSCFPWQKILLSFKLNKFLSMMNLLFILPFESTFDWWKSFLKDLKLIWIKKRGKFTFIALCDKIKRKIAIILWKI